MRSIGQYKVCQPMCNRGSRRWRKRKGDQKYIWGNYGWKLTKPKEGIDIQVLEACVDMLSHFICVWFFETLWTVGCQAPLCMGFSRQGYWSEFPGPSPGDLPDPEIEQRLLHCRWILYPLSHLGSPTVDDKCAKTQERNWTKCEYS